MLLAIIMLQVPKLLIPSVSTVGYDPSGPNSCFCVYFGFTGLNVFFFSFYISFFFFFLSVLMSGWKYFHCPKRFRYYLIVNRSAFVFSEFIVTPALMVGDYFISSTRVFIQTESFISRPGFLLFFFLFCFVTMMQLCFENRTLCR